MVKVALVKGRDRYNTILRSLQLIEDEVKGNLRRFKRVIIKPNFVSTRNQLAATHVDHIRAILDFLRSSFDGKILIAESAAIGDTFSGYRNFGYLELCKEYDVELVDLEEEEFETIFLVNRKFVPLPVRVSKLLLSRENFVISAAKLKTHDEVVVTLSLKNILMGAVKKEDKSKVHQGVKAINYNLFLLAQRLHIELASIDGIIGMQGNGPVNGEPINSGVAIASTDPVAADRVGCEVMGVKFEDVGYLWFCAESGLGKWKLKELELVGDQLGECRTKFKLHVDIERQLSWRS